MARDFREGDLDASVLWWKEAAVPVDDRPPAFDGVVHRAQVVVRLAERKVGDDGVSGQVIDGPVNQRRTARQLQTRRRRGESAHRRHPVYDKRRRAGFIQKQSPEDAENVESM